MPVAIVTGSAGLVGAESVRHFARQGFDVVGIDNDMRGYFFGEGASTAWSRRQLEEEIPGYRHRDLDIRDGDAVERLFAELGTDVTLVIHAAAQPSHDWAAREPVTDFTVNANGTLVLLEAVRRHCPEAAFIFTSTNKVYGDTPNRLPLVELETRWELDSGHPYFEHGIDEAMGIDQTLHSLFGASKVAADVLVQEYGRYFGLPTAIFRGGCLTGPGHSGTELHGFLSHLMRCAMAGETYTIFGYGGKQVRDNIHCSDLVACFDAFRRSPRVAEVYNIGGGRHANCSLLEAVALCERITGKPMARTYSDGHRRGDHKWWISDLGRFRSHYPDWEFRFGLEDILVQIHDELVARSRRPGRG